jgi:hypothetical protein
VFFTSYLPLGAFDFTSNAHACTCVQDALEVFDCMMNCLSKENAELCTELRRQQLSEQLNLSHSLVPMPLNTNPQKSASVPPLANPFRGLLCR